MKPSSLTKKIFVNKLISLILALCVILASAVFLPSEAHAAGDSPVVVGYYGGWAPALGYSPDKLPADRLTHINYAFADIDPSGRSLVLPNPETDRKNFQQLRALKQKYSHLRTLLSVGGWDYSLYFSNAAASQTNRQAFAQSCVNFVTQYGFDGIDLDWEYPVSGGPSGIVSRPQDRQNFTLLLQAVRSKLDEQGRKDGRRYLLTIAAGADSSYLNKIEPQKVAGIVDHIFLMAYDYHGSWDRYADLNAPLYTPTESTPQYKSSVNDSVQAFLNKGIPAGKLVLGMPFYGRLYQGVKSANNGLYSVFSSSRSVTYREISSTYLKDSSYAKFRHSQAQVPTLYGKGSFLSYDDPQSIAAKALLAKSKGLAGFGAWELSQDSNSALLESACQAWLSALPFSDVLPGAWYYDEVAYVWDRGIMNGTSASVFAPGGTLTRGMLAQILHNLEGNPAGGSPAFSDVPAGAWYAKAVNWAAAAGLVDGYGKGKFGPGDPITREQLAVMLYRYARYRGQNVNVSGNLNAFSDRGKISSWADESVAWAVGTSLLQGKGGGVLDPRGRATRAETASLLTRFLQ